MADRYELEAQRIITALDGEIRALEHFGTTAVEGLRAKPIIDILIGTTADADQEALARALDELGYESLGEDARRPGRRFWRKRDRQAFNVSAVPHGEELWETNFAVRDFLRSHHDWSARYAEAKQLASTADAGSMLGYQNAKREFVDQLRTAAVAWRREP